MSESDKYFVDSNVVLYQFSPNDPGKQAIAKDWMLVLWSRGAGRISWQVIHEFYSISVNKFKIPTITARRIIDGLLEWDPAVPTTRVLYGAWHWCDRANINYWDALIVAAAEQSECRWLLSEDLQDGQHFGSVTVINPFLHNPGEFGLA
jgi:predicted nucleic acid-binding protein